MNQQRLASGTAISEGWLALLPDKQLTHLLRALIGHPDHATTSWSHFVHAVGEPSEFFEKDHNGLKALLPMLEHIATERELPIDDRFRTRIRVAALREELRAQHVSEITCQTVNALAAASISALILPGLAVGQTAYAKPMLRHNHALQLLTSDPLAATKHLLKNGYQRALPGDDNVSLTHSSGLAIALLDRPLCGGAKTLTYDRCAREQATLKIGDEHLPTLSVTHQLIYVLLRAASGDGTRNLRWAFDACALLSLDQAPDWDELYQAALAHGLSGFITRALRYLKHDIGAIELSDECLRMFREPAASERSSLYAALRKCQRQRRALRYIKHPIEKLRFASWVVTRKLLTKQTGSRLAAMNTP